jgi:outer membrane receptor protein involved in Fe transport
LGNSELDPYISDNIDLGFEYYTGDEGYFGFAAFRKSITGFTVSQATTMPFGDLAQYGVTYATLTPDAAGGHQRPRRSERRDRDAEPAGQCRWQAHR